MDRAATQASPVNSSASSTRSGEEEAAVLSLMAARVASAAGRAARGITLTREERAVLSMMSKRLQQEANAVSNTEKPKRRAPERAGAVAAGFTVDAWVREQGREPSVDELVEWLTRLSKDLDAIGSSATKDTALEIAQLFRKISPLARAHAGLVGERILGGDVEFA